MRTMNLGPYSVGVSHPPLFMAEIGTYFNQDIDIGKHLIRQIKDSGADIVKGEILHTADICLEDKSHSTTYVTHKKGLVRESYRELVERKVVPLDEYKKLFALCGELGLPFVLSVYDFAGADFAVEIGASALKIASSNVVHSPLIRYAARFNVPVLIDTGKSTMEEISRAVQWLRDAGCEDFIIEHSPAAAPAPLKEHHLRMLRTLKYLFGVPVGLSDHHSGDEMMYAAVALGANIIEKPVCIDPAEPDQDFYWAMPVSDLKEAVQKCRNIHEALGSSARHIPQPRKVPNDRMGLVAKEELQKGTRINLDTVDFAFPSEGIPVEMWDMVEGRRILKALNKRAIVRLEDVDFSEN